MTNETELIWAKLNGDWSNPKYRRSVAANGRCLEILAKDVNRAVSNTAARKMIDNVIHDIRNTSDRSDR